MSQFVCKKCGEEATTLDHKFCTVCGSAYDYVTTKIDINFDHPIYVGVLVLHEQFYDYYVNREKSEYKYFDDLISKNATQLIFQYIDLIIELLDNDFQENLEIKKILGVCRPHLKSLFFYIIINGYFAWVAENKVNGSGVIKLSMPNNNTFIDECFQIKKLIYPEFCDSLMGLNNGKYISSEMANILMLISIFRGSEYFRLFNELKPLDQIYDHIQSNFAEAVVFGYAIALVDAKYRN